MTRVLHTALFRLPHTLGKNILIATFLLVMTGTATKAELIPLPPQPASTPWPDEDWPTATTPPALQAALDHCFTPASESGSRGIVVIQGGKLIGEKYADGFNAGTRFQSWSMAKSVTHALMGILVRDGQVDIYKPAKVARWNRKVNDVRAAITIENLLRMESGLFFAETYDDPETSSAMQMLFGVGRNDMGEFAAGNTLIHEPGTHWAYSSGTTNIISSVIRDIIGATSADDYQSFMQESLFRRIGITSAVPEFDNANTFIGSSYLHMTARDWARFGLLYLRDGVWNGHEILPRRWVEHARLPTPNSKGAYGAHFWLNEINPDTRKPVITERIPTDAFMARGFGGQVVLIVPSRDLIVVHLGLNYGNPAPLVDALAAIVESIE
ncbi:MAG: serine hydrolase [Alphaproteobacteria bacterium]|jgi:CubicO group peptidase (beta-lactamase class C family)|nr:serine hydrolase [Rhodobiaceae bacterium]MBO6542746.1 serine hydrolase [Alphaproteobacteria bacterium]MBO6628518.1 serine hydrolase [Alphaproteobacteria bacterium]